jgi:hypothetical protein
MKSLIVALLGVLAIVAISGCTQTGQIINPSQENKNIGVATNESGLIRISQDNFYFMGMSWLNNQAHNYEEGDRYWCYDYISPKYSDGLVLKYKLVGISKDYYDSVTCKVYDGTTLVRDYPSERPPMIKHNMDDPIDMREITVSLTLNQNHNLNICCYIYASSYSGFADEYKPISNEVCFSKQIGMVKCDRNLDLENYRNIPMPDYFA